MDILPNLMDFLGFLVNPGKLENTFLKISEKFKIIVIFLIFNFIFLFFIYLFFEYLNLGQNIQKNQSILYSYFDKKPIWIILLLLVIIAPFFEELLFRFPLVLPIRNIYFSVLLFGLGLLFGISVFISNFYCKMLVIFISVIPILFYFFYKRRVTKHFYLFWNKHFAVLFYLSVLCFGLIHLKNYNSIFDTYKLSIPLLIIPQFLLGSICGYIRIKLGFSYTVIYHSFYNLLLTVPIMFFSFSDLHTNYIFKIEEVRKENVMSLEKITSDTIDFQSMKVRSVFSSLLMVSEYKVEVIPEEFGNTYITLSYSRIKKSKTDNSITSRTEVLNEIKKKYNLKIQPSLVKGQVFNLVLKDTSKFNRITRIDKILENHIGEEAKQTLPNKKTSLRNLAFEISYRYNKNVIYKNEDYSRINADSNFNIFIPSLEFEELQDLLMNKYGIAMVESIDTFQGYLILKDK